MDKDKTTTLAGSKKFDRSGLLNMTKPKPVVEASNAAIAIMISIMKFGCVWFIGKMSWL